LQGQCALKKLAAMQTTAQNKVPFQQGTAFFENLQNFTLGHADRLGRKALEQSRNCDSLLIN